MTKLNWDASQRPYISGLDRGVLFPWNWTTGTYSKGYAWNGLISVEEQNQDSQKSLYVDGRPFDILDENVDTTFKISAFTYPDEFEPCLGFDGVSDGNEPLPFALIWRTDNGGQGNVHILFNSLVSDEDVTHATFAKTPSPEVFVWNAKIRHEMSPDYGPVGLTTINLDVLPSSNKTLLLNQIYGTSGTDPALTTWQSLMSSLTKTITVSESSDIVTVQGSSSLNVIDVSATSFDLNTPNLTYFDSNHWVILDY